MRWPTRTADARARGGRGSRAAASAAAGRDRYGFSGHRHAGGARARRVADRCARMRTRGARSRRGCTAAAVAAVFRAAHRRGPARTLDAFALRRRNGAAPRAAGGTVAFAHSAFWRQAPGSADDGEEGYIGPVLRELKAHDRRTARRIRCASSASARAPISARAAGGIRCAGDVRRRARCRSRRSRSSRRARAGRLASGVARSAARSSARCSAATTLRDRAHVPRLRRLAARRRRAARHRAAAVSLVGARDGRSGRRARRLPPARWSSPTPKPAAGAAR